MVNLFYLRVKKSAVLVLTNAVQIQSVQTATNHSDVIAFLEPFGIILFVQVR